MLWNEESKWGAYHGWSSQLDVQPEKEEGSFVNKKEENQTIHGSHSTYQYITVQCVHSLEIRLEMLVDFVSTKIFQNFCCSSSYSNRITSLWARAAILHDFKEILENTSIS